MDKLIREINANYDSIQRHGRLYGKLFGVTYYAEKIANGVRLYVINNKKELITISF